MHQLHLILLGQNYIKKDHVGRICSYQIFTLKNLMGTSYLADFGTNARSILTWILYRRVKSSGMWMLYQLEM
jgi:hypothetical protein